MHALCKVTGLHANISAPTLLLPLLALGILLLFPLGFKVLPALDFFFVSAAFRKQ